MDALRRIADVHTIRPDDIDFARYSEETEEQAKIRPISDWLHELIDEMQAGPQAMEGARLPWSKTHDLVRLRKGEMSVWAGVNGHGKSLMLGQIVQGLIAQQKRTVICSFEMKPLDLLKRFIRQSAGCKDFTIQAAERWSERAKPWVRLYDQRGQTPARRVYQVARYAAEELGADHFIVDSLMKIVKDEDDSNAQKAVVDTLFTIAQDYGIHVHLVHHMRKGEDEFKMGGKFDLKGSGAITDLVDNVFIVWKNKKKLAAIEAGKEVQESEPDSMLSVEKQRNGEWEGRFAFWFHAPSQQFVPSPGAGPMPFDDVPATERARPRDFSESR